MSSIENVKPGQWLIITYDQDYEKTMEATKNTPFQMMAPRIKYTGVPFRVVAVSPPFLLVQIGQNRSVVDTRQVNWTQATKRYVKEFKKINLPSTVSVTPGIPSGIEEPSSPPEKICPRCGNRMIEKVTEGINVWHLYCDECGGEFI